MRWAWASALLALAVAGTAVPAAPGDRLGHFKELARQYAEAPDPPVDDPLLAELFGVVDDEVIENLRTGGLFASVAFIQERLEAFSDEWGGAAFKLTAPSGGTTDALMLGLFTLTRGEPRGSLRIYGRSDGTGSLLAAVTREGSVEVRAWPDRNGAPQFLASWLGPATGRRSRALHLELWRQRAGGGAGRVWSSGDAFPEGLPAIDFAAKAGQILVRYEVHYPGWKPGCAGETEQEDVYYYLTLMNENYPHPAMPAGAEEGIVKGMYLLNDGGKAKGPRVQLLGSGTILREVIAAAELLKQDFNVTADIWSVTSFNELRRDGLSADRWNLLHPTKPPRKTYVEACLDGHAGPVVASTDYMRAFADQVRGYIPRRYITLGTDGFGRSDYRIKLRRFFEVNRDYVVVAALKALADEGEIKAEKVDEAIKKYGLDPERPDPWTV